MSEKLSLISNVLGRYFKSGGEYLFKCPYCKHAKNKFSVNIEKNVFKCWICDARGSSLYRIFRRFGTFNDQERWKSLSGFKQDLNEFADIFKEGSNEEEIEQILELPQGFRSLTRPSSGRAYKRALEYLACRGLNRSDILKWKIGYTTEGPYQNRIVIPSFNSDGDLNYYIARTFSDDYRRYKNPQASRDIVFNELYVDFDQEVIIVEGVFDAIKCHNAVPILGSTIRETSRLFRKIIKNNTPILLALDPDASKKSGFIKRLFLKYGIEVREITYEDDRDLGDMSKEEVLSLSKKANFVYSHDSLISAISAI